MKKQILALVLGLVLIPFIALAQEKKGTVDSYDEGSRMVTIKGKDWEQKAKVPSSLAKEKADLLKAGTKVNVEFEDRGGGDIRVKSISGR
ncbi:MAG TPA: hypothetical protein VNL14_14890 [Candidatus Acidoferrales bacterium]|nr:hypothetical protein [Candidatus Acidoferrales bacterium]